ncbi:vesicular glutamate transporter 1-like isoform X3 [Aphis gossypii]|uniref:vesicular glutamate transporter 1-like isoform X3 n=1 Tax=Aphis gossypii TaxID=80765 RepID=UPI00215910CA|nr:vesicular glutamate transporter 1-like isoform X3 [Aphis gossypii]
MNIGQNDTNRWDFSPQFQQPSYRLHDRFIRLKRTYWNRQYAIILLAYTGLTIVLNQFTFHYMFFEFLSDQNKFQINSSYDDYIRYYIYGYIMCFIPGGVLSTIYPAHNILGISVTISSIVYLIIVMSIHYIDAHTHFFLQFCMGITMAGVFGAIDRVWTYWVPLNTQSIRHVPIILYDMTHKGEYIYENIIALHHTYSSYTLTLSIGVFGLAWYVLWLYVINENQFRRLNRDIILFGGSNNPRYPLEKPELSLTRSIVTDIPWKSLFTSMPILVIFLSYVFDGQLYIKKADGDLDIQENFKQQTRTFNIILLIIIVILVELAPEIIVSITTTNIRKFWNWLYFGLMFIYFILEAIVDNTLETNQIYFFILIEIEYLSYFGYFLNYLDIAPKYASLISSLLMVVYYTSTILWDEATRNIFNPKILNDVETNILKAVICLLMGTLYSIYGSAEIQLWAADKPVEDTQRNLVENEDLQSV